MARHRHDRKHDASSGTEAESLPAGKRTSSERLPARDSAVPRPRELAPGPAPVVHDDPFGLHLEPTATAAPSETMTPATEAAPQAVQRKSEPTAAAPPPPAEQQTKAERLEEGRWKFAFLFTGGRYGKHAKKYLSTYYPNHEQHDAKSLEDMFRILGNQVAKLGKARDKRDPDLDDMHGDDFVEEIVLVSHGTAAGSLMVPMLNNDKRIFTPWDVSDVQAECDEGMHQKFETRRKKALRGITADTRVVVRGCEVGDSHAAMNALQTLFGGKPTIFAPHHFQGFQTDDIDGARFKGWKNAFKFLLDGGYIPAELAEEPEEDQRKYIYAHFGDGVPSEFFIVNQEDHDALEKLYDADKKAAGGPAGEKYKKRLTTDDSSESRPFDPHRLSDDWETLESADPSDPDYSGLTAAEISAKAVKVWETYKPEDGATIMRLWEQWQRASQAETWILGEDGKRRIDKSKIDTRQPIPQIPDVFSATRLETAAADAEANPANQRTDTDEWEHLQLDYKRPDQETVDVAHDFSQSQRHTEQLAGPAKPLTPAQRTRRANRRLVGDLLAGIDAAARSGLEALKENDGNLERAAHHAEVASRRIEHLLSITALPGKVEASLRQFADEAAFAMGRAEELVNQLVVHDPEATEGLTGSLAGVSQLLEGVGWKWKPIGLDRKGTAGKFKRTRGTRIGTGTLAMIEHRARFLKKRSTPDAVTSTASTIATELGYATAEIALAAETEEQKKALTDEVRSCGRALRELESLAWGHGVGAAPELDAMREALRALHGAVDISPESSRMRPFAATSADQEAQFLFAISDQFNTIRAGKTPDAWMPLSPELDEYVAKVRIVVESMYMSALRKDGGTERAAEVWGEARHKVLEIIGRASAHSEGDDNLMAALELGHDTVTELDHDVPRARAADVVKDRELDTMIADPESGFYEGIEPALGASLDRVTELWLRSTDTILENAPKGWSKDVATAKFDTVKILVKVWYDGGSLVEKLAKAKKEGLNVQTVSDLVVFVIDITKDLTELVADGIKAYAKWKAVQYASDAAKAKYWTDIADHAGVWEFSDNKLSPGQYLGAALGVAQMIQGILQFQDAMEKDDTRGMVAAGHTIVQGGAGLAGALLNATIATQALVAGTIFLWWATIDAMGTLGGMLAGMARDRKLRAVESLVSDAGKVAVIGREMAASWDASNEMTLARDPWMDGQVREMLMLRALSRAEIVKSGIDSLFAHFLTDDKDYVGGYDDLGDRLGPRAKDKMQEAKTFSTPGTLTFDCSEIFMGIDRMARYAMAAEGPARGTPEAKAQREAIDSELDAERDAAQ